MTSYATLIAVLCAAAFVLPFLARLAERAGVPRGPSIIFTLAFVAFVALWLWLRRYLQKQQVKLVEQNLMLDQIAEQRRLDPLEPTAFFLNGQFQGDILRAQDRAAEALYVFEAYRQVLLARGEDVKEVKATIRDLRRSLGLLPEFAETPKEASRASL